MKRFQQLIVDAKAGLTPWESLPKDRIPMVARELAASDITDIIGELDRLALEKDETPSPMAIPTTISPRRSISLPACWHVFRLRSCRK
jgi:hypothetical protein